jgi:hypothetical protein
MLDGVPFFVENEAETSVLMKECQPLASRDLIGPTLAESRDLAFAHPNLNEGGLDTEHSSDNGCINAECAIFKIHYGHGARHGSKRRPALLNFKCQPLSALYIQCLYKSWAE